MLSLKNNVSKLAFAISVILSANAHANDSSYRIEVSKEIPKGFESISQTDNFYDIYYENKYIATLEMKSSLDGIKVKNPDKLLSSFNLNKYTSTKIDVEYINQNFNFNKLNNTHISEGLIVTRNSNKKRIDIYKEIKDKKDFKSSGLSWKSSLKGNTYSNFSSEDHSANISLNNTIAFNEYYGRFDLRFNNDKFGVSELSFSHEIGDDRLTYGAFNSQLHTYNRLGYQSIIGINFINNAKSIESGNSRKALEISLSSDAVVRIEKNNILLKVINLSSGMNIVQTDDLPAGNYPVLVKISYNDGRNETRKMRIEGNSGYHLKSGFVGFSAGIKNGLDQNIFNEDIYEDPEVYFTTGYKWSLFDNFDFYLNAAYDKEYIINPTFTYGNSNVGNRLSLKKTKSGKGYYNDFYIRDGNHYLNIEISSMESDFIEKNKFTELSYYYNHSSLGTFSASYQKEHVLKNESIRLFHNYTLLKNRSHSLTLTTSYEKHNNIEIGNSDREIFGFTLSYQLGNSGNKLNYNGSLNYRDNKYFQQSVTYKDRFNNGTMNHSINTYIGENFNSGYLQSSIHDDRFGYGNIQVGVNETTSGIEKEQSYYANSSFDVQVAGNSESAIFTGKKNINEGIILDLSESEKDDIYLLSINKKKSKLKGGTKHIINLKPHNNYEISLLNQNSVSERIIDPNKEIYIHKNNLYFPEFKMGKASLIFTQIHDNNGIIKNAHVSSDISQGFTDEKGYLVIEKLNNNNILTISNNICKIKYHDAATNYMLVDCEQ